MSLRNSLPEEQILASRNNEASCVVSQTDLSSVSQPDTTFLQSPDTNKICSDNEAENELDYRVLHFLAETTTASLYKKKGRNRTPKTETGMLKCSRCSASFRYKSTLSYHMKSDCGTKIIIGKQLVKKANSKQAVICDICKKKLCSRTSLMVHMRIHTGERPFECAHCGRSFFQKAHLRDHMKSLHSPGRYLCRVCNATYPDRASLHSHLNTHFPTESYHCQECDKRYTCRGSLAGHIALAHGEHARCEQVACGACTSVLNGRDELRKHRAESHGPSTCQHCGLTLPNLPTWRSHLRRVHPPSPLRCTECARRFSSSYDLRIHVRSHSGERPYECRLCGRGFARKSTLDMHTTLHTGRKDYVCPECRAAFNRKSKLDVHLAQHYNTSVQCAECSKVFKCKSYLVSHLKTHDEDSWRWKCASDGCSRRFKSRRGLIYHMKMCPNLLCSPPATPTITSLQIPANVHNIVPFIQ